MPKQTKICRVCGATYEACNSARSGNGAFNWREVACSPECGMVYLNKVIASRSIVEPAEEMVTMPVARKKKIEKHEPKPELEHTVMIDITSVETGTVEQENIEATE